MFTGTRDYFCPTPARSFIERISRKRGLTVTRSGQHVHDVNMVRAMLNIQSLAGIRVCFRSQKATGTENVDAYTPCLEPRKRRDTTLLPLVCDKQQCFPLSTLEQDYENVKSWVLARALLSTGLGSSSSSLSNFFDVKGKKGFLNYN